MKVWVVFIRQRYEGGGVRLLNVCVDSTDAYEFLKDYLLKHPGNWVNEDDSLQWYNPDTQAILEYQECPSEIQNPL